MKKLNNYEVAFRISRGVRYMNVKAKDIEDVIARLKKKHYSTNIIESITKVED